MIIKSPWFWILSISVVLLYLMVQSLSMIFFPFFMGFVGAYALNGPVTRLSRLHISRPIGSALMVLLVLFGLVMLVMVFIPFVQSQLISLAYITPKLVEAWTVTFKPLLENYFQKFGIYSPIEIKSHVSQHVGEIFSWSLTVVKDLLSNGMVLANVLSLTILTPIIMFYLLKDFPSLIQSVYGIVPLAQRSSIAEYAQRIDGVLSDYVRGQAMVCLVLMVLYTISLGVIGVKDGVFIGIMTGFMSFIPYLGVLLGLLATLASGFAHFQGWDQILFIFIIFGVIGVLEGNVLSPRLVGEKVGLHPVWIIFALLAAGTWFGFLGILFALPLAAVMSVSVRILMEKYKESAFFKASAQPLIKKKTTAPKGEKVPVQ